MATILIEKNVAVPLRDGTQPATDVYHLDGAAPAPALVTRTPYDKDRALDDSASFDILRGADGVCGDPGCSRALLFRGLIRATAERSPRRL